MEFKLRYTDGNGQSVKFGRFNGGEVYIKSPFFTNGALVESVSAYICDSDGIMALLLLKNALDRNQLAAPDISLHLPYVPYARQDRIDGMYEETALNSSLSIEVMADLVNQMNFKEVIMDDPHSSVTPALIKKSVVRPRLALHRDTIEKMVMQFGADQLAMIAPDSGALKETYNIAKVFGIQTVVVAEKVRDMATGKILKTKVHDFGQLVGKHVLICDDICDGGRTFTEIGAALRGYDIASHRLLNAKVSTTEVIAEDETPENQIPRKIKSLSLLVTHGIFSNNVDELLKYFDEVHATYSWISHTNLPDYVTVKSWPGGNCYSKHSVK